MTLADAIREGSKTVPQAQGWGDGVNNACAIHAAGLALKSKGYK